MPKPRVCVIIPAYGLEDMTMRCINYTSANAGIEHTILLVDDGSPEPLKDFGAYIIRLDKNRGWTVAVNEGILWCGNRFDYIWLINNDTEPQKNSLKRLVDVMDDDSSIGIASSVRVNYVGDEFKFKEYFPINDTDGTFVSSKEYNNSLDNHVIDVPWQPGVALLLSTKAARYVGLFDERMRQHCSDNDYCFRMRQMGYRVVLVTSSEVKHYYGSTCRNIVANKDQKVLLDKRSLHAVH